MQPRSINQIMQNLCSDLFELTPPEKAYLSVESRAKEMPKICEILELDPATLKPRAAA